MTGPAPGERADPWRHARIHDAGDSGAPPRDLTLPNGNGIVDEIYQVEFLPSGDLVATGTAGFYLALWDTATWEARRVINARAVAFSPDGSTVVTGAADGTLRLWDPRKAALRATLPPPG